MAAYRVELVPSPTSREYFTSRRVAARSADRCCRYRCRRWPGAGPAGRAACFPGESRAMRRVIGQIERVAPTSASIIITGESGTGKEETARAIHDCSQRRRKDPYVGVNCGAIPESLVESELFGHERGSFTKLTVGTKAASKGPTAERCCWTRLPKCDLMYRRTCCVSWRSAEFFAWAVIGRHRSTYACLQPPIVRWMRPCVMAG